MKHSLLIACLALISVFIHGYKFAYSDQEIFIPYLLKVSNSSLFPNDHLFDQISANTSLFYPIYGQILKFADIETLFFMSFLLFKFFFLLAIFRLAFVLLKDKNLAYLATTMFLLPKFIGGTATSTFDDFFGYRSIGVIFLIFYLSYLIEQKTTKSALFAIGGLIFHALSIIPNILLLPALLIRKRFSSPKTTIVLLTIGTAAAAVASLIIFQKNDLWWSTIALRDGYVLPSTWTIRGWLSFALYFSILVVLLRKLDKKIRAYVLLIAVTSLILFLANFVVLDVLKIPQTAKFQLARSITPVAYIALAMSPLFLSSKSFTLKLIGGVCIATLALNKFELFVPAFAIYTLPHLLKDHHFKIESKTVGALTVLVVALSLLNVLVASGDLKSQFANIQLPKSKNDWISLQLWAKENTPVDAAFLVPPNQTGFRIFSQRPIVGDIKDGAVVIYNDQYASYWQVLVNDLANFDNLRTFDFKNLRTKYNFDFIVTSYDRQLELETVYKNKSYIIYSFR